MDPCTSVIKLLVGGDNPTIVNVHKDVLCKTSKFFKRSLKPEWTSFRADGNAIDLSDDDLDTVKLYANWLYSGNLPLTLHCATRDEPIETTASEAEKIYVILASAYVFGEKIIDVTFKNKIVNTFRDAFHVSKWSPGPESVNIVFSASPSGSPLRRLIADFVAYGAHHDCGGTVGWHTHIEGYSREALMDAMQVITKVRKAPPKADLPYEKGVEAYLEEEGS